MSGIIKTKEEFLEILKENKYFENFEEQALYNFEAIKFYIDNYSPVIVNKRILTSSDIIKPAEDVNFQLTNLVFKSLRKKFGFE